MNFCIARHLSNKTEHEVRNVQWSDHVNIESNQATKVGATTLENKKKMYLSIRKPVTQMFVFGQIIPEQTLFEVEELLHLQETEPDMTEEERLDGIRECWLEYEQTDNGWIRFKPDDDCSDEEAEETYVSDQFKEWEDKEILPGLQLYRLPHSLDEREPFVLARRFQLLSHGKMMPYAIAKAEQRFWQMLPRINAKRPGYAHLFLQASDLNIWLSAISSMSLHLCQVVCDYLHDRPGVFLYQTSCGCCS